MWGRTPACLSLRHNGSDILRACPKSRSGYSPPQGSTCWQNIPETVTLITDGAAHAAIPLRGEARPPRGIQMLDPSPPIGDQVLPCPFFQTFT